MSSAQIYRGISELLTLSGAAAKDGRRIKEPDLGLQKKASLVVDQGKIVWLGPEKSLPSLQKLGLKKKPQEINLKGASVLPGFIECHTHSVFAGDRSQEFEWKQAGVSYQEIAARGGGILSTMQATRKIKKAELQRLVQSRATQFLKQGVTTLEIKSGYGLDTKSEIASLEAVKSLAGQKHTPRIVPTFLGAHAVPPEFVSADEYLEYLVVKIFPILKKKKLARRIDIFVEQNFFSMDQAKKYLRAALAEGFEVSVHADQLSLCGGTKLALELGALSADHVLQVNDFLIQKLAESHVTAVLLPIADLYMKCSYPRARAMIDQGVRVALATDFNPGTAPSLDLTLVGVLARLEMKMTLPEVIAAYTVGAATALGLEKSRGSLGLGMDADFTSIDGDWSQLFYSVGSNPVANVWIQGKQQNALRI